MKDGHYTELFFLDEATALAAGHRPCAECRRDRYKALSEIWLQLHGKPSEGRALPKEIDRTLHSARVARGGIKVTFKADVAYLPGGAMFAIDGKAYLIWKDCNLEWSFEGYRPLSQKATRMV